MGQVQFLRSAVFRLVERSRGLVETMRENSWGHGVLVSPRAVGRVGGGATGVVNALSHHLGARRRTRGRTARKWVYTNKHTKLKNQLKCGICYIS